MSLGVGVGRISLNFVSAANPTGFWINLLIGGAVAIILLLIHIPEQITKEKLPIRKLLVTLDLLGFGIFLPASIMFFLALTLGGNQFAWNSATVIGLFVGAGVTFIIFLFWEWRTGDEAMLPFSILRKKILWSSCVTRFFYMGDIMVVTIYLPIYFQSVKLVSPVRSGYYTLPVILIQMIFAVGVSGAGKRNITSSWIVIELNSCSLESWIFSPFYGGLWDCNGSWGRTIHPPGSIDINSNMDRISACFRCWEWTWNHHCQYTFILGFV
jgi:hypothetical protein